MTSDVALRLTGELLWTALGTELPWMDEVIRARRAKRLPTVLTSDEVRSILARMDGEHALVARLMYGTGMRVTECLSLRVKDLDLARRQIVVRQGKGGKDRVTMVPESLVGALAEQLEASRAVFDEDRRRNVPGASCPSRSRGRARARDEAGRGIGCSRRTTSPSIRGAASAGATTPTTRRSSAR
jgi:integrase